MSLASYSQIMRPAVENELQKLLNQWLPEDYDHMRSMIAYHMGWEGEGAGPVAQGKRIRSLLLLLSTVAAGGDWQKALPAAAAIEYIHNFSLVHDDIQDNSHTRRGRTTLWVKWGIPQAINIGDAMFTLGFIALSRLQETISVETALKAVQIMQVACFKVTQGQYLDLSYEQERIVPLDIYWPMVEGKTAALLSCCTELGALIANVDERRQTNFSKFGRSLGLAFQVVDDWLGIWGDQQMTGKPTGSDLVSGKKTLPVLYALGLRKNFAERWMTGPIRTSDVERLSGWLEEEGAKSYTEEMADNLNRDAMFSLKQAAFENNDGTAALYELAESLVNRRK